MFVVSGPGGVGKGTLVQRLIAEDPRLVLSSSWTTRPPREGESPDAYRFVDRAEFEAERDAGGFLEWAVFLDHMYATPVPNVPPGHDVLLEIDVQGAAQVRSVQQDAIVVLVLAPSAEVQAERLRSRGDDEEHIRRRLKLAELEEREGRALADFVLINDDLARATEELARFVRTCRERRLSH